MATREGFLDIVYKGERTYTTNRPYTPKQVASSQGTKRVNEFVETQRAVNIDPLRPHSPALRQRLLDGRRLPYDFGVDGS
jgi:hypothetical protein